MKIHYLLLLLISLYGGAHALGQQTYAAQDTLDVTFEDDANVNECLSNLIWEPQAFEVQVAEADGPHDALVAFDSPMPTQINPQVQMLWYQAEQDGEKLDQAPAILMIHSLHPEYVFARLLAHDLSRQGVHVFVVLLPGFFEPGRYYTQASQPGAIAIRNPHQAIANARRARDAIVALPSVDSERVVLQGTSLGAFTAVNVAALDQAFDAVFLVAAGTDVSQIVESGLHEAQIIRRILISQGLNEEERQALLVPLDPALLAHRLSAESTWLYSGEQDEVIAPANAQHLAEQIGLAEDHHLWLPGNHVDMLLIYRHSQYPQTLLQEAGVVAGGS